MAQFTVRIELHNAHSSTYNSVHKDLHHVGFTHITECNGIPYQMPHAEYNYEVNITKEALLEEIKGIVFKHVSSCGILVTQWAGQASYGLKKVQTNERSSCFFCNQTATTEIYTLSLHDALPI